MVGVAVVVLAALAVATRVGYPRWMERRDANRFKRELDGIISGAAPIALHRPKAPGVLLLHGGGDTPQVMSELAQYLYDRGFSVRVPLLAGHGRAISAFGNVSSRAWEQQVSSEYADMLREHAAVGVVGLSMGGALAIALASERPEIPALVLLAPYVDMPATIRRMAATAPRWGWLLPYFSSSGGRSIHDPRAAARGLGYGVFTPAALHALYQVMDGASRALSSVKSPTLMIQSRQDNRIAATSAERAFGQIRATEKKLVWTEGAGHVITVDYGFERVFALAGDWLDSHLRDKGPADTPASPSDVEARRS